MEFIENYSGLFIYPILSIFFSLVLLVCVFVFCRARVMWIPQVGRILTGHQFHAAGELRCFLLFLLHLHFMYWEVTIFLPVCHCSNDCSGLRFCFADWDWLATARNWEPGRNSWCKWLSSWSSGIPATGGISCQAGNSPVLFKRKKYSRSLH